MSKPFDDEKEDEFESLKIDEEFEDVWGDDDDDFVDISLDGEPQEEEDEPQEAIQASARPVRKIEKVIQDPFAEELEDEDAYTEEEERSYGGGRKGGGRKSYLILALICVVIVAAVAVALKFFSGRNQSGDGSSAASTEASTEAATSAWTENGNEAVVQLVNQYYTALKAADMTTLQNIMDASSMPDETSITQMNSYIEDYQNIVCYTMAGEAEGEYAVYIAYDAKFRDISTLAPGLTPAYVLTDSAGTLRLVTVDNFDDRILEYMNQVSADEQIVTLGEDIMARYNEALASDAALNALVNPDGTQPETSASQDTTAAESTAAESQTAETTAPESTAAETTAAETTAAETTTAAQSGGDTYTEQTTGMVFQNTDTIMYTNDQVRARTAPTTDGDQFDIVAAGTRVHVIGQSDSWSRVYLPEGDGTPRYIRSDLLTSQEPAATE